MATALGGYMGRVVEIDLSTQEVKDYPWSDDDRRLFIGGKIMAARILDQLISCNEEPFSEEAPLIRTCVKRSS